MSLTNVGTTACLPTAGTWKARTTSCVVESASYDQVVDCASVADRPSVQVAVLLGAGRVLQTEHTAELSRSIWCVSVNSRRTLVVELAPCPLDQIKLTVRRSRLTCRWVGGHEHITTQPAYNLKLVVNTLFIVCLQYMLGFVDSPEKPVDLLRHRFPSKVGGAPVSIG